MSEEQDTYGIVDNDRSSIEVSENGKGVFSYKVKIYFNSNTMKSSDVIKEADAAYKLLHKTFKNRK